MINKIQSSPFVRSVIVLMTGTVVAQLLGYLTYPILTRIFTPSEMGDLGYFNRIIGFIAAIATARYELSLPIVKQNFDAFGLYKLSIRIALVVLASSLILGTGYLLICRPPYFSFSYLIAIVLGSASLVWANLGTNWAIRFKLFRQISQQRVANALGSNGFRLIAGWIGFGSMGLVWGTVAGFVLASIPFVRPFQKARKEYSEDITFSKEIELGRLNKQYPLINLPHVLVDIGVDLLVATFMIHLFSKEDFGYYSHAYAMLRVPLSVIGQSISQVFVNECSMLLNSGKPIIGLVKKTMRSLFFIALIPFSLLYFFGEELFSFVFGHTWRVSGVYASYLAPFLFFNFVLSPISTLPLIIGRQREFFFFGIAFGLIQIIFFGGLPYFFHISLNTIILFYSLTMCFGLFIVGASYLTYARLVSKE